MSYVQCLSVSSLVDPTGMPGTRAPLGSIFFHFHAVFGKKLAKLIG